jgi:hypothetical protein
MNHAANCRERSVGTLVCDEPCHATAEHVLINMNDLAARYLREDSDNERREPQRALTIARAECGKGRVWVLERKLSLDTDKHISLDPRAQIRGKTTDSTQVPCDVDIWR